MKKFSISFVINVLLITNAFAHEKQTVYIYQDEGVGPQPLAQTISIFKGLLEHTPAKTINAQQVKDGSWCKDAALFVMPGGADLPYVKKLNGDGNSRIKKFVEEGGAYLGICAGSYYGSSYVEFDKGGRLEVLGDRELSFFQGKAIGPILAPYDYFTQRGCRAAKIQTILTDVPETIVLYNGGGFFENADQYPNTTVIGTYENNLPAIVLINYGKGKALLSGVHLEYDPCVLDTRDRDIQKIIDPLYKGNESRKILFTQLMQLIGVF